MLLDELWLLTKILLLMGVANGSPIFLAKIMRTVGNMPLDLHRTFFDGRRLFGDSKTIRGVLVSVILSSLCAPVLGLHWIVGFAIGFFSMLGDLLSSFIKRRLGMASSSMALGLDQIPESFLPALACRYILDLQVWEVTVIVVLFFVLELVLSVWLYKLKIRDTPY